MLLTGMDGKEYGDTPGAAAPASGYGGPHGTYRHTYTHTEGQTGGDDWWTGGSYVRTYSIESRSLPGCRGLFIVYLLHVRWLLVSNTPPRSAQL